MDFARIFSSAVRNNRKEFDQFVERFHRQAYNIAYRMTGNHADADDLTQESFLRAYRFFDRYNRDMPFENWLYRIMSRVYIDEIRKRPKFRTQSLDQPISVGGLGDGDVMLEIPDAASDPENLVLCHELEDYLQQALLALPEEFRIAVILADIEGLSYEEIAENHALLFGNRPLTAASRTQTAASQSTNHAAETMPLILSAVSADGLANSV